MTRTTPLDAVHRALGASMAEFAGYDMPMRYGSAVDEHHAVRQAAGLFDLSHMAEIDVTGPGAAQLLDATLLSRLSALDDGQAKYTMLCNEDGGIVDDLIAYRFAPEWFCIVANASNGAAVLEVLAAHADRHNATVVDRTDETALLAVQGPAAAAIVSELVDPAIDALRYYRCARFEVSGTPVVVARTGYTGEDGFELYLPASAAEAWWAEAMRIGEPAGLTPAGLAARDTLRLEAGMPLYGHELGLDTTPFDVQSGRLVDFDKADFIGRTALLAAKEAPTRRLVGVEVEGRRPAREGYVVLDAASGNPIGQLTSGTKSPTLGTLIAMALIDGGFDREAPIHVDVRGEPTEARFVDLPFYKRQS